MLLSGTFLVDALYMLNWMIALVVILSDSTCREYSRYYHL